MRALQVLEKNKSPEYADVDIPTPPSGFVLIRIVACGLNFADLLLMDGSYQETPPIPFTLGMEISGFVEAVGEGVRDFPLGSKIAAYSGHGGLAEYGIFPANRCILLPQNFDMFKAAGFQITYGTSHMALFRRAQLKKNENLLIMGAAGGIGLTAIELGKLSGSTVIAVARGENKLKIAQKAGADYLIDSANDNLTEQIKSLGGADVVFDSIGGNQFSDFFRACNPESRILIIGFASGQLPKIKPNHLMVKNISVLGVNWPGYFQFNPKAVTSCLNDLIKLNQRGNLSLKVNKILPFKKALEGLELLRNRKTTGKLVVSLAKPN